MQNFFKIPSLWEAVLGTERKCLLKSHLGIKCPSACSIATNLLDTSLHVNDHSYFLEWSQYINVIRLLQHSSASIVNIGDYPQGNHYPMHTTHRRSHYEVGVDLEVCQQLVSQVARTCFHLELVVQLCQGRGCDMHASAGMGETMVQWSIEVLVKKFFFCWFRSILGIIYTFSQKMKKTSVYELM